MLTSCVGGKFFKDKYGSKPEVDKVKNYLTRKLKSGDWYITADEAVYYGFADEVIRYVAKTEKLKQIDEAWLGLDSIDSQMFNPMSMLKSRRR